MGNSSASSHLLILLFLIIHSTLYRHHHSDRRTISDMSQPSSMSSSSSFQGLFNAALQEYENQTGTTLPDHPFTKQLEACDSADSITAILQEQAQIFCQSRRDDAKMIKALKSSVDVLYTLSNSSVFGQGIGLVHSKSFIGIPFF